MNVDTAISKVLEGSHPQNWYGLQTVAFHVVNIEQSIKVESRKIKR